jgi:hypothetical protein
MKHFPYLPADREQRQQADALKKQYGNYTEECFTLAGKQCGEMLLILLNYHEEPEWELPE